MDGERVRYGLLVEFGTGLEKREQAEQDPAGSENRDLGIADRESTGSGSRLDVGEGPRSQAALGHHDRAAAGEDNGDQLRMAALKSAGKPEARGERLGRIC